VFAQAPNAPERAAAQTLYDEARALMNEQRFAEACPKLEESQRLDPGIGTLLYLGECYARNGQTATAWATFQSAADAAKRAGDTARQKTAEKRAAEVDAKTPKLAVSVPPTARISGLEIRRNNVALAEAGWDLPTPLDPGEYTIEATAPGHEPWSQKVTLPAENRVIPVEIPPLTPSKPPESAESPPPSPAPAPVAVTVAPQAPTSPPRDAGTDKAAWETWQTQHWLGLVAAGTGIVGIGVGTAFGLAAKAKEKDSEPDCDPDNPTLCSPRGVSKLDDAGRKATVSNIGFIAGGVLVAGGIVLYLTAPPRTESVGLGVPASRPRMARATLPSFRIAPVLSQETQGMTLQSEF